MGKKPDFKEEYARWLEFIKLNPGLEGEIDKYMKQYLKLWK